MSKQFTIVFLLLLLCLNVSPIYAADTCVEGWDAWISSEIKSSYGPGEIINAIASYKANSPINGPNLIQQIMIGIVDNDGKVISDIICVYNGIAVICPAWTTGTKAISLKAPVTPATYKILVANYYQFSCLDAQKLFPDKAKMYKEIATITVSSQPLPSPKINSSNTNPSSTWGEIIPSLIIVLCLVGFISFVIYRKRYNNQIGRPIKNFWISVLAITAIIALLIWVGRLFIVTPFLSWAAQNHLLTAVILFLMFFIFMALVFVIWKWRSDITHLQKPYNLEIIKLRDVLLDKGFLEYMDTNGNTTWVTPEEYKQREAEEERIRKETEAQRERERISNEKVGYIYIMRNPSFEPDLYKIGHTKHHPIKRLKELNTTGVPELPELKYHWKVADHVEAERLVFEPLKPYRKYPNKEFFKAPLPHIRKVIEETIKDMIIPEDSETDSN